MDYAPEHLTGSDTSIASQVNRHLLAAFQKPACLPATPDNETAFEQWYQCGCCRADPSPLDRLTIILAVRKKETTTSSADWSNLSAEGIYFQALEDREGEQVLKTMDRLLLMVWDSPSDLQAGIPPILLRCHASSFNIGPNAKRRGTNRATSPMKGFGAAVYDEAQLMAMQSGSRGQRSSLGIWSGRDVELFDFEFRPQPSDCAQIDGSVRLKYQFHLEVDHIIFPAHRAPPDGSNMLWTPESFAVAKSDKAAKLERVEGYYVPPELRSEILIYLSEDLLVDRKAAKNLPVDQYDHAKEGKRISKHPLHDTFIGEKAEQRRDEFYEKSKRGALVAEIDQPRTVPPANKRQKKLIPESIARVQRVFTTKLDWLQSEWASIAKHVKASKHERDHQ